MKRELVVSLISAIMLFFSQHTYGDTKIEKQDLYGIKIGSTKKELKISGGDLEPCPDHRDRCNLLSSPEKTIPTPKGIGLKGVKLFFTDNIWVGSGGSSGTQYYFKNGYLYKIVVQFSTNNRELYQNRLSDPSDKYDIFREDLLKSMIEKYGKDNMKEHGHIKSWDVQCSVNGKKYNGHILLDGLEVTLMYWAIPQIMIGEYEKMEQLNKKLWEMHKYNKYENNALEQAERLRVYALTECPKTDATGGHYSFHVTLAYVFADNNKCGYAKKIALYVLKNIPRNNFLSKQYAGRYLIQLKPLLEICDTNTAKEKIVSP